MVPRLNFTVPVPTVHCFVESMAHWIQIIHQFIPEKSDLSLFYIMVKTALLVKDEAEDAERVRLIQQKIQCCKFFMVRSEEDVASMNTVADKLKISTSSLSCWMNKLPQYHFLAKLEKERFSLHPGHSTQLEVIGPELLASVGDLREKGYAVSRKMIVAQACRILGPECAFSCKSYAARAHTVSHWMKNNNLTIRAGTHQSQALP